LLARARDAPDDRLAVDRERERAADARVVEGWSRDVDAVEVGAEVRRRAEVRALGEARDEVRGHLVDPRDLARQVEVQDGREVLRGQRVDRGEGDAVRVPVARALPEPDPVARAPLEEAER